MPDDFGIGKNLCQAVGSDFDAEPATMAPLMPLNVDSEPESRRDSIATIRATAANLRASFLLSAPRSMLPGGARFLRPTSSA